MSKYAEYCYCKGNYTNKCDNNRKKRCKAHPIWKQGIGFIGGKGTTEE